MHLIAKMDFSYAGKSLKPGDAFEAAEIDGALLIQGGRAKEGKPSKVYHTAAVTAETKPETPHNPRGHYKRRDMRSEN